MKIVDNHENFKEKFVNIPEGSVFRFNNQYYMKTKAMFLYDYIDDLLKNDNIYDIDQLEAECLYINVISLNGSVDYCHLNDDAFVEPLKTELHIV